MPGPRQPHGDDLQVGADLVLMVCRKQKLSLQEELSMVLFYKRAITHEVPSMLKRSVFLIWANPGLFLHIFVARYLQTMIVRINNRMSITAL